MSQGQIVLSAQFATIYSKLNAFKKLLSEEEMEIYTQTIAAAKEKFLANNSDATQETIDEINKFFKA